MSARVLIACGLFLVAGCGKSDSKSTAAEPKSAAAEPAAPIQNGSHRDSSAATSPADEAQLNALLAELTQAVRKYGVEQQRVPKTLEEVRARGYLSTVPVAPPGKKFVIDRNLEVILESR
ncbi:MAG: hypothetical protein AB1813_10370 [Verrucomicrobiota bacterium]